MIDVRAFTRTVSLTAALAMAATGCSPKQPQKVLAGEIEVTSASSVLTFDEPLHATYPWTEVLFETEHPSSEAGTPLAQAQGAGLKVALVQAGGQELRLELSFVNQYLEASSLPLDPVASGSRGLTSILKTTSSSVWVADRYATCELGPDRVNGSP